MTRRERLERKVERRREWADKAETRSTELSKQSHDMMSVIPMGQPILVGHHSEKRDRNYRDRAWNKMGKAVEQGNLATHHTEKAAGLEAQLENSIFSDDSDAVEAIEKRIAEREAERERMKLVNKLYRKGDAEGLKALGIDLEALKLKLAAAGSYWGKAPHLPYEMSNLGGRITADKKRLEVIKARRVRTERAEAAPNGVLITEHGEYSVVTFAEKPEREILQALRNAGFSWGNGNWSGKSESLPAEVRALIATNEPA
jgi:DNA repair exonuclease SbcCD ATPase subunit